VRELARDRIYGLCAGAVRMNNCDHSGWRPAVCCSGLSGGGGREGCAAGEFLSALSGDCAVPRRETM